MTGTDSPWKPPENLTLADTAFGRTQFGAEMVQLWWIEVGRGDAYLARTVVSYDVRGPGNGESFAELLPDMDGDSTATVHLLKEYPLNWYPSLEEVGMDMLDTKIHQTLLTVSQGLAMRCWAVLTPKD